MFRSEISPMFNNYKTLQKESELKYLNAQLIEAVSNKKTLLAKKLLWKIGVKHIQGQALLNIAINGDDAKTAEILFEHDAKLLSLPNNKGLIPLFVAIGKGKQKIVELLLKYNIDVDKEFEGTSPISLAVSKGFTEMVDILIKYKKSLPEMKATEEVEHKKTSTYHDGYGRTLLTIASEKNDIETAKCVIEHYPELVTELNTDGSSALFVAASKGHGKMANLLISKRANVNQAINGVTPIYLAAAKGYHTTVKLLLDNHADANQFYQNIQSTLSAAISSGSVETSVILLAAKANVDAVDRDGMTPLHTAVHYQNDAMVKLILKYKPKDDLSKKDYLHMTTENESLTRCLLEAKVDANSIANESLKNQFYHVIKGYTPLTAAIIKNHDFLANLEFKKSLQLFQSQTAPLESKGSYVKVIAALLQNKPQLDKPDSQGYLPLHYAAKFNDLELTKKIVESKANINMPTSKGDTPLMIAVRRNNPDLLKYLLNEKADIQCTDKNDNDLLMMAVYCGSYAVVSSLLKSFDVNKINYSTGMTPLMGALYQYSESREQFLKLEYLRTIEELLKNKASFMKKGGKSDSTPLSFLIQNNLNTLLPILLKYHADNNLNGYSNKTFCPLHEAVISNKEEVCKILLNQPSVNVNQYDGNGMPPLYYAIIKRQKNIVELLLKNGANTTVKCINNKSTLDDLLKLDKHKEMRQLIQSIKKTKPALRR